jgi:hypothetical protein
LFTISEINVGEESTVRTIEISPGKSLYINSSLKSNQQQKLIQMIQGESGTFAWDYYDVKGINLDTCIHHIYTNDQIRPITQPQRRMIPYLKIYSEIRAPKTPTCQFYLPYFR